MKKTKRFKIATGFTIVILAVQIIVIPASVIFRDIIPNPVIFDKMTPLFRLFFISLVGITIGTVIIRLTSKKTLDLIADIDSATKEIANGNYNIRLEEKSRLYELNDMAQNFNLMAKDLAASEIMKNDFISNVSHEFKTPLAAIEGYATLLQKDNLSEEKIKNYAKNIALNSKRLSKMTSNILLLSSLDNGKKEIDKVEFCLDEQIREIVLLFEKEWNEKNVTLDLELEDCFFFGHKELLSHIWQNLFGNAIKFSDKDDTIEIKLISSEDSIKIIFKDYGCGMSEEETKRVFDRFYQAENSRASEGNGLGLAIVKRIIDVHKGEINVFSNAGEGSTFTIILPITNKF